MTTRIKLRRDTAANWTTNNPVLALGEAGYDTTNNQLRIGDGTTVWSGLESIGGSSNNITAEKTYSDNYNDGSEHTFAYTTGSIAVQIGNDNGLYLDDLLSRWTEYFDGNLAYPYNYSNVNLVINPGTDDLASTVTNVTSSGSPPLYTITLGTAHPEPITIDDIDFNYTYVNTIGLDTVNDFFGMATGDDDIDIRSGRDINLIAADDINIEAGSTFDLTYRNLDDNSPSDGIDIRTITTSTDYTWTFRFDGNLDLPGGLTLPTKNNTGYEVGYDLDGPTLQLSSDNQNQVIVTGPATTEAYPYAQRIVIQGQRGYGSTSTQGEGGDVYIWGGVGGDTNNNTDGFNFGGGSGGDIKLRGGQGLNNYGGYIRIEAGNVAHFSTSTTGDAGFVEITGGDVTDENEAGSSYGGNVRITGGRAYSATTQSGVVQVITGGYTYDGGQSAGNTWEFGNDGTLTLPNGGIISGHPENYDAIRLEPTGVSSSTQALLIYPTVQDGNHIHLTAGGGETDLYLGNDSQYVKVDHGGTVVVQTYSTATTSTWTFGTDGGLTFPDATVQTTAYTGVLVPADGDGVSGNANMVFYAGTDWYNTSKVTINPTSSMLTLNGNSGTGGITFPDATVQTTAYPGYLTWSISAIGSSNYTFSGPGIESGNTDDPILYLYRGFTYKFINTTETSHPFAIRVSNGGADYTTGVSGSQTGTQTFTVPMNAPSTLYYQCTIHGGMGNTINIV